MPKHTRLHDRQEQVTATCAYIADWLRLVQHLLTLTRMRYGISSKELLAVETALAFHSRVMAEHSVSPLYRGAQELRDTVETKRKYLECLQNCWRQAVIDDPLTQGLTSAEDFYTAYPPPTGADDYHQR